MVGLDWGLFFVHVLYMIMRTWIHGVRKPGDLQWHDYTLKQLINWMSTFCWTVHIPSAIQLDVHKLWIITWFAKVVKQLHQLIHHVVLEIAVNLIILYDYSKRLQIYVVWILNILLVSLNHLFVLKLQQLYSFKNLKFKSVATPCLLWSWHSSLSYWILIN